MSGRRSRSVAGVLLAIVSVAVMGVTSVLTSAFVFGLQKLVADVRFLADEGWIMGGTGIPVPPQDFLDDVSARYLTQFAGYNFQGLTTPEQFCPIVCLPPPNPQLNFGDSVNAGVADLDNAIRLSLLDGDNVAVFGYSQSAVVATQEMHDLIRDGVDTSNLQVVLVGDPNSPIGGILTRFQFPDGLKPFSFESAPQHLPFLNVPLSIAPTPTSIATDIYTAEYDGWANFPQDPSNLLADLNAIAGILTVHPSYPTADLGDAIELGTIGSANFYMIPTEQLPILWPLYQVPYGLPVVAEAMSPGLSLYVDWAYGNPGDPGAGIPMNGVDPIGVSGPWAVTATGQLSDASGVAGFFPKMDPLQMFAGVQYAGVQGLVAPIDEILRELGQAPLPDTVASTLLGLSGYDLTNQLDAFLLTGWNDLATGLNLADLLGPDVILNGAPLISGQPLIDLVGVLFDIFDFFGA